MLQAMLALRKPDDAQIEFRISLGVQTAGELEGTKSPTASTCSCAALMEKQQLLPAPEPAL